jgi:hypothetical protein
MLVLEAVVDQDLRFWHAFFGLPGTLSDLNILDRSPLMQDLYSGNSTATSVSYTLGEKERNMGYYLADGIYPDYPIFMK